MTDEYDGPVLDEGGEVYNVANPAYGAKGDTLWCSSSNASSGDPRRPQAGAVINAGSTSLASTGSVFTHGDVGKVVTIQGAGASGAVFTSTVASYVSTTNVILASAAVTSVPITSPGNFTIGTDDTEAIVNALSAAGAGGRILLPPGIFTVRGASNGGHPITVGGRGGLVGYGGHSTPGTSTPNTTLLCADTTAGVAITGSGTYQGFMVDGNQVSATPLQNTAGGNATFIDVWATASAGAGWTITGVSGNAYYDCGSVSNLTDGVYIDGGASNLHFNHWMEFSNQRYGIHGDVALGGNPTGIRFYSGICDAGSASGQSKVYIKGGIDWAFRSMDIVGNNNISGPCIVLDQTSGYGYDFTDCWIWASTVHSNPGTPCMKITGSPGSGTAYTFLRTDGVQFVAGDNSVYIDTVGSYRYAAANWNYDGTNGPYAPAGLPPIDLLLAGRTGSWNTVAAGGNWNGNLGYRVNADGTVQLKGSLNLNLLSPPTGPMVTLPAGYRPSVTLTVPIVFYSGSGYVTIAPSGVVTGTVLTGSVGGGAFFDGVAFPIS